MVDTRDEIRQAIAELEQRKPRNIEEYELLEDEIALLLDSLHVHQGLIST